MIVAHEYIRDIVKDISVCGDRLNFIPANKSIIESWIASNALDNNIESYPLLVMQTPVKKEELNSTLKRFKMSNVRFIIATETELNYTTEERYEKNFKPILFPILEAFKKAMEKSNRVQNFDIISFEDIEFFGNTMEVVNDKWDYIEVFADITLVENCDKC